MQRFRLTGGTGTTAACKDFIRPAVLSLRPGPHRLALPTLHRLPSAAASNWMRAGIGDREGPAVGRLEVTDRDGAGPGPAHHSGWTATDPGG